MAINSLIRPLPVGTAYCVGIVLIVMMSGCLVQAQGSLARAVLPFVLHLKWGWHRVERALERGKLQLDEMIDQAYHWSLSHLEVEPVRLGPLGRQLLAVDSSTIARLRSKTRASGIWGKGYCHVADRAVRANLVAAAVSIVSIRGVELALLRRLCFGDSPETAIAALFEQLPAQDGPYLVEVDAGIRPLA